MLSHMETDVGAGIAASIRGNIFRYTEINGRTDKTESDIDAVLAFKHKVLYEFKTMDYDEVKAFARKWIVKYPNP